MKVWMDGYVVDAEDARVPVTDHGLLYGDGVFEGIRMRGGRLLYLERHLARLHRGAKALGLALPMSLGNIGEVVKQTFKAHGQPSAYARLLLTRGEGPLGVDPTTCPEPRLLCIVAPISLFSDEQRAQGLSLVTVSQRRADLDVLDPTIKSLNYLGTVLAKRQARIAGADDALVLNKRGTVAEAAVANVFVVSRGALWTPPVTDGCLPGINRGVVLEMAAGLGMQAHEQTLGVSDLTCADEVFLTGSGAGVIGVRQLDGVAIGRGVAGSVTARVADALEAMFVTHGERVVSSTIRPTAAPVSEVG